MDWEPTTVALVGTTLTAIVTVVGWSVAHVLTSRREDRTRRLEAAFRYSERQIEELYGPVLSLVKQIFTVWDIRNSLLFPDGLDKEYPQSPERQEQLRFFQEEYFFPLHERIRAILASKLHLVDGETVPESFYQYLRHSTQELIQNKLEANGLSPAEAKAIPWPRPFHDDLQNSLNEIQARADRYLRDLEPGGVYRRDALVTAGTADSPTSAV